MHKRMHDIYSKNLVLLLLILFLLLFIFSNKVVANFSDPIENEINPVFDLLTREEGLSNLSVSNIIQDKYGFLWFSTQSGLNCYNGREFKIYHHDPFSDSVLIHNLIQTMFYDEKKHELWIGTYQGVSRLKIKNEEFINYSLDSGLADPVIVAITKDQDGYIWFGTLGGLNRMDPLTGEMDYYEIPKDVVRDLKIDSQGQLWIGSYAGLLKYEKKTDTVIPAEIDLPGDYVMVINEYEPGILSLGVWGEGLLRVDISQKPYKITEKHSFNDNRIYTMIESSSLEDDGYEGLEWIGTWGGGLFLLTEDNNVIEMKNKQEKNRPAHSIIYSLFQDESGIIWLGTNGGGLNKINPAKKDLVIFSHDPDNANSLSSGKVNDIFVDNQGDIWFSIYGKGVERYEVDKGKFIKYKDDQLDEDSILGDNIIDILELEDNILLMASDQGIIEYNSKEDSFKKTGLIPDEKIAYSLGLDKANNILWIGTYNNGLYSYNLKNKELSQFKKDEISDNLVFDILVDSRGRLWVATNNGLNFLEADKKEFRQFFKEKGNYKMPASNTFRELFEDSQGRIWIGTIGGGLSYYNEDGTFTTLLRENGLASNEILSIEEDNSGYIWAGTHAGISLINPNNLEIFNLTPADGIGGWEFNTGHAKDDDGNLLFGGIHGITSISKDFTARDFSSPPIYITDVAIFQNSLAKNKQHFNGEFQEFQADENFISFEYTALDYDFPDKISYYYKLEGFDEDWIYAGDRYYTSYSNLSHGDYKFKVRAETIRGNKTGTAVYNFSIARPWYLSIPAYIGYILTLIIIIIALVKIREGYILNKKNKQLNKLNEKLEELSNKDSLTEIYNRHYFNYKFKELFKLSKRSQLDLSLIIFDIDDFKKINDSYGHLAGDHVLKVISKRAEEVLGRETDFIARYGGDEFVIVLHDTDLDGVKYMAQKIKNNCEKSLKIKVNDFEKEIVVSISLGIASFVPDRGDSFKVMVNRADQALYEAKSAGKSNIKISHPGK